MTALKTQVERTHVDEAIFAARDGRRARRLRNSAIAVGVLAILWIVGLGVGTIGFGSLPGVGLVKGARADTRKPKPAAVPPPISREAARSRLLGAGARTVRSSSASRTGVHRAAAAIARRAATPKKASRPSVVTTPAAPTQTPTNPATRTRGWARKGYQAPRGLLRKSAPPPPATSRGRQVGRTKPLPPPPAAVSPGQAKKAAEPPPPPPPPRKG
jgi:hypothetical protein